MCIYVHISTLSSFFPLSVSPSLSLLSCFLSPSLFPLSVTIVMSCSSLDYSGYYYLWSKRCVPSSSYCQLQWPILRKWDSIIFLKGKYRLTYFRYCVILYLSALQYVLAELHVQWYIIIIEIHVHVDMYFNSIFVRFIQTTAILIVRVNPMYTCKLWINEVLMAGTLLVMVIVGLLLTVIFLERWVMILLLLLPPPVPVVWTSGIICTLYKRKWLQEVAR